MDVQHLIDILFGIIMAFIGFVAKNIHTKTEDTAADLSNFKAHVAENYSHNNRIDDLKDSLSNMNKRLDTIYELLTKRG